jgi:hypothetical protein
MIKQILIIQGKVSLSLDLVSFSLILAYSSKESRLFFEEPEDF